MNISTVRALPETKAKLEKIAHDQGFSSMAHFFTRAMETLIEQVEAGQKLVWPLRFEEKQPERPIQSPQARPKKKRF